MWQLGQLLLGLANIALAFATLYRPSKQFLNRILWVQGLAFIAAFVTLMVAFVIKDFDILYVASNSNSKLPLMYRISAAWGSHEGSFLLWVVMLNVWGLSYLRPLRTQLDERACRIFMGICLLFGNYIFFFSNPFEPIIPAGPVDGQDLNPLLQDPGMIIHPPLLYAGYVGFIIPFVYVWAVCDLKKQLTFDWTQVIQMVRWSLVWLTAGICLGSWWAYRELGWGGFWFWDPVENASLMPWLAGMLVLHVAKSGSLRQHSRSFMLAILAAFILGVLGTFMVRSGILVSVHTFASDPKRGVILLVILAILLIGGGVRILSVDQDQAPVKKAFLQNMASVSSLLFLTSLIVVVLGTLYPLIYEVMMGQSMTVGAPYFNQVHAVLVLMVLLSYVYMARRVLCKSWLIDVGVLGLMFYLYPPTGLLEVIIPALIIGAIGAQWRSYLSLRAKSVHTGFCVVILGVFLHYSYAYEYNVSLRSGQGVDLGPVSLKLEDIYVGKGENYEAFAFDIRVQAGQNDLQLFPERRHYPVRDTVNTKSDIARLGLTDIYVNVGQVMDEGVFAFRFYSKPGVVLLWAGGAIMALGLILRRKKYVK